MKVWKVQHKDSPHYTLTLTHEEAQAMMGAWHPNFFPPVEVDLDVVFCILGNEDHVVAIYRSLGGAVAGLERLKQNPYYMDEYISVEELLP